MATRIFILDEGRCLAKSAITNIEALRESNVAWIDLLSPDDDLLRDFLKDIGPPELLVEAMDTMQAASHIALYEHALMLRFPVATPGNGTSLLSVILADRIMITIRQDEIASLESVITQYQQSPIRTSDPAMMLFELIDRIVDDDTADALAIRHQVDKLEQGLELDDDNFEVDQVNQYRHEVVALEAVMEDQRRCLGGLQTSPLELLRVAGFQEYLRDTVSHLDHNIRVIGRTEDHLAALQQHHSLKLQDQQNSRLQLLTVISAIFLPLTLITGIYGMNFSNMPELAWKFGYGFVLLLMLTIGVILLFVFYHKNWFR